MVRFGAARSLMAPVLLALLCCGAMALDITPVADLVTFYPVSAEEASALLWNSLQKGPEPVITLPVPQVVLAPNTTEGVVRAFQFAVDNELKVCVRYGGYDLAATSLCAGGLTIDVDRFHNLAVDAATQTAVVGPGVSQADLFASILPLGLYFPPIDNDRKPLAILTAGALGLDSRQYGFLSDSVSAFEVVTLVNGTATPLVVDANNYPMLFRGMKGAGQLLGVVTSLTIKLQPSVPSIVTTATTVSPFTSAADALTLFSPFVSSLPAEVSAKLSISRPAQGQPPVVSITSTSYGSPEAAAPYASQLESSALMINATFSNESLPFAEWQAATTQPPLALDVAEFAVDGWVDQLTPELVDLLTKIASDLPAGTSSISVTQPLLPATTSDSVTNNFIGKYLVSVHASWTRTVGGAPADKDMRYLRWANRAANRLEPFLVGRYCHTMSYTSPSQLQDSCYSRADLRVVKRLKAAYDPTDVLRSLDFYIPDLQLALHPPSPSPVAPPPAVPPPVVLPPVLPPPPVVPVVPAAVSLCPGSVSQTVDVAGASGPALATYVDSGSRAFFKQDSAGGSGVKLLVYGGEGSYTFDGERSRYVITCTACCEVVAGDGISTLDVFANGVGESGLGALKLEALTLKTDGQAKLEGAEPLAVNGQLSLSSNGMSRLALTSADSVVGSLDVPIADGASSILYAGRIEAGAATIGYHGGAASISV